MNERVIHRIARKAARAKSVGQSEALPEQKPGFFTFDPEWARLKRKYLLKANWYELYKESEQYAPEPLKAEVRQAYRSFKLWEKNFTSWSDVAFREFPEQLYKQTVEYSKLRQKVLPHIHAQNQISNTIPGVKLARTPPQQLSQLMPGIGNRAVFIVLALGALWIFMNRKKEKDKDKNR